MRGDLTQARARQWVKEWQDNKIYEKIRAASKGPREVHPARRPTVMRTATSTSAHAV